MMLSLCCVTLGGVSRSADPYAVLGVPRGADEAQIHAAYRAAVRRTHPDAGGSTAAFEAVQEAYEALREPAARTARSTRATPPRATRQEDTTRPRAAPRPADTGSSSSRMEDLLAESRRLEDEARRLAGLPPRHDETASPADDSGDSVAEILRDAGQQIRDAADEGARELRGALRRML